MALPSPIQAYFEADIARDSGALVRAFAPDAVVKDEGRTHVGRAAIDAWWRAAKAKYEHAAEPLEFDAQDDVTRVRAKVTGRFPGSPAMLTFAFRLAGDRIAALEIGA